MKYLKLKIEDAVNATKAAIEEGIVPGGGVALVKVSGMLEIKHKESAQFKDSAKSTKSAEDAGGYSVVVSALLAPLTQIVLNAGKDSAGVIIDQIMKGKESVGYDAMNDVMVDDMFKAGIIDPVKVTRTALQNAASAAAIMLTTEVAIADEPKEESSANGTGGMPGMGGMGY
jgi:chaperonin GroEL